MLAACLKALHCSLKDHSTHSALATSPGVDFLLAAHCDDGQKPKLVRRLTEVLNCGFVVDAVF
jgi:hypothetical protein